MSFDQIQSALLCLHRIDFFHMQPEGGGFEENFQSNQFSFSFLAEANWSGWARLGVSCGAHERNIKNLKKFTRRKRVKKMMGEHSQVVSYGVRKLHEMKFISTTFQKITRREKSNLTFLLHELELEFPTDAATTTWKKSSYIRRYEDERNLRWARTRKVIFHFIRKTSQNLSHTQRRTK